MRRRLRVDVAADALPALLELLQGRGLLCAPLGHHLRGLDRARASSSWSITSGPTRLQSLVSAHTRIPREPGRYISVYDIYKPAAFFERDIHEMFGVYFEGSPDMSKFILTEWDGPPPMRKDFDSEAWVNEHFDWQDYHPDWLKDLEAQGGGIAIRPTSSASAGGTSMRPENYEAQQPARRATSTS